MSILTIPYQTSNSTPNYSAGYAVPVNADNVAPTDGAIVATGDAQAYNRMGELYVRGALVGRVNPGDGSGNCSSAYAIITKGDVYRYNPAAKNPIFTFFPMRGG